MLPRMNDKLKRSWPWRFFKTVFTWALALVLLFEEWGWVPLARMLAAIGRLPGLRWIEGVIRTLPPYAALAMFLVPMLTLLPIKILALYWLSHGHKALGLALIILAKVGGTAVTARLFMLTQPTLMRLAWFARLYARWMAFKTRIIEQVRGSAAWVAMGLVKRRVKVSSQRLLRSLRRFFGAS